MKTLKSDDKLRRWIENVETVLLENMYAGQLVKKRQIPFYYVQRYGVNNLFRYRHPESRKMVRAKRQMNADDKS